MKRFLLLAITTIVMVGCSNFAEQDALPSKVVGTPDTIYATFDEAEADSRTYVEQGKYLRWNEGDEISFFPVTYNMQYRFKGKTGDNNGAFEKITTDLVTGNELKNNYAVYPYKASTAMSDEGIISFELPAVQHYAENSFGVGANTMVAITSGKDDNILRFKNCGGYLKLQLYGDATVKSIELKGNSGEKIAGASTITAVYGGEPSVAMADGATTSITLDCGDGVALGATADAATAFWFVVPPTTFENGFTVTVTNTEGAIFEKSTSNTTTIDRNTIQPMAEVEVKCAPVGPANNEIWYTATQKIEPHSKTAFGANYVSTKWNEETGEGVIIFDGDVTFIGDGAFNGFQNSHIASNLTSVTIPNSVTSIGGVAFYGCASIKEFKGKFSADNGRCLIVDDVFKAFACGCGISEYTIPDGIRTIGLGAFNSATCLTNIIFSKSVKTIEEHAFQDTGIINLTIPDHIISIGEYAFQFCDNLETVIIGNSVGSIGGMAFYSCCNLSKVTIGEGVGYIGGNAFTNAYNLKEVYCLPITPPHIASISYTFSIMPKFYVYDEAYEAYKSEWSAYSEYICKNGSNPEISTITIQYTTSNQKTISPSKLIVESNEYVNGVGTMIVRGRTIDGFADASNLVSIIIPNETTCIQHGAFEHCTSLTSVTIGDSVSSIGERAFYNCRSLTSVTIPDSVTSIGKSAFYNCTNLANVNIGKSVTLIEWYAFQDCEKLTNVTIPDSVNEIYEGAFSGCSGLINVILGRGTTEINTGVFADCTSLKSIAVPNLLYVIRERAFYNCSSLTSVTIPDSVTKIGEEAFYNCSSLTSVTIPDSVTKIGEEAFYNCRSLTRVDITDLSAWCKISFGSYDSFGSYTANPLYYGAKLYLNGSELTDITIPSDITEIKDYTFRGCTSLTSVTIPDSVTEIRISAFYNCTSLKSITIPNSVTSIGYQAFYNCSSLTSVTIPDSVTSIGDYAFYDCTSLTSVAIPDSVTSIGPVAFSGCTSLKEVYCKPTTPPTGGSNMFSDNALERKIYVPAASVEAYKAAEYWSDYASYIVGYDF